MADGCEPLGVTVIFMAVFLESFACAAAEQSRRSAVAIAVSGFIRAAPISAIDKAS